MSQPPPPPDPTKPKNPIPITDPIVIDAMHRPVFGKKKKTAKKKGTK